MNKTKDDDRDSLINPDLSIKNAPKSKKNNGNRGSPVYGGLSGKTGIEQESAHKGKG